MTTHRRLGRSAATATRREGAWPRRVRLSGVLAALLALGSAGAQTQSGSPSKSATGMSAFALAPGDALRLRIWREPDLSGEFTVDENGVVNLPKLGQIHATAQPVGALKAKIISSYAEYVTQPVEVTPLIRVRVLGAVRTPGLYRVEPVMTLADAIALAGGTTAAARSDRVRLMRDGRQVDAPLSPNTTLAESPLRSGDHLFVPERSWVSRNPGVVFGGISAAATVIWALRRQY
jgi:polysaccharide biosynthesis/export protein